MTVGDSAVDSARLLDADEAGDDGAPPPTFCAVLAAAAFARCCMRVEVGPVVMELEQPQAVSCSMCAVACDLQIDAPTLHLLWRPVTAAVEGDLLGECGTNPGWFGCPNRVHGEGKQLRRSGELWLWCSTRFCEALVLLASLT